MPRDTHDGMDDEAINQDELPPINDKMPSGSRLWHELQPAETLRRVEGVRERGAEGEKAVAGGIVAEKIDAPARTGRRRSFRERLDRNANLGAPNVCGFVGVHCGFHTAVPCEILRREIAVQVEAVAVGRPFV